MFLLGVVSIVFGSTSCYTPYGSIIPFQYMVGIYFCPPVWPDRNRVYLSKDLFLKYVPANKLTFSKEREVHQCISFGVHL